MPGADLLKSVHTMLAYLTVVGFLVRGLWSLNGSPMRDQRWVRVLPHIIDTALLSIGLTMAYRLSVSLTEGWLAAKLIGLLAYIGFGVVTMRARSKPLKLFAFVCALTAVGYIFTVAFSRSAWPFG